MPKKDTPKCRVIRDLGSHDEWEDFDDPEKARKTYDNYVAENEKKSHKERDFDNIFLSCNGKVVDSQRFD